MLDNKPLNILTAITSNPSDICPGCKSKKLIASDFIKVIGYKENIPWICTKCPDEMGCGFAREGNKEMRIVA